MTLDRRHLLIRAFDDIRPSFLAALDQIIAEVRPVMAGNPAFYPTSVLACAEAFADSALVRSQLVGIDADFDKTLNEEDLTDAHLACVSYLFSLILHEMMRAQTQEMPAP